MKIAITITPPNTERWNDSVSARMSMQKLMRRIDDHINDAFMSRKAYANGSQAFLDDDGHIAGHVEIGAG